MIGEPYPVVAGLRLTWQLVGPPSDGFGLWVVNDPDALLDELTQDEFERTDERMPYFGTIWESAEALATCVLVGPPLDGLRLLDLGCGLGACGFAAARRGARVTFFDWEPRALAIAAATARAPAWAGADCTFVAGDWRHPPPLGRFERILGADVLYERRNAPAVAAFLARHLAPGAEAWIADPGRPQAAEFPAVASSHGLELVERTTLPHPSQPGPITLLRLRLPGGPGGDILRPRETCAAPPRQEDRHGC